MKHFETFKSKQELQNRLSQLKSAGFAENEYEVLSKYGPDVVGPDGEVRDDRTLGEKIKDFFTGEDRDVADLDRYNLDPESRDEAEAEINRGNYVLFVNRDEYYADTSYAEERDRVITDDSVRDVTSTDVDVDADRRFDASPDDRTDLSEEERIRLHEERLRVDKENVQTGEVDIHKEVVTETQEVDVPVRREEVSVERHRLDEPVDGTVNAFEEEDGTVRVPIYEEKVDVQKETVATEELVIKKDVVEDTEHITEEVRKENVDIDEKTQRMNDRSQGLDCHLTPEMEFPEEDPDSVQNRVTDEVRDRELEVDRQFQDTNEPSMLNPSQVPNYDPSLNPAYDPTVDPLADPRVDPIADPEVDPMADPDVDPMADPDRKERF